MNELEELSLKLLEVIYREDLEHYFKNGGYVNGRCKASEVQTQE